MVGLGGHNDLIRREQRLATNAIIEEFAGENQISLSRSRYQLQEALRENFSVLSEG